MSSTSAGIIGVLVQSFGWDEDNVDHIARRGIEPEEVEQVESAGPLAGLRGVLMAEPIVAMPRAATGSAARLEVTER